MSIQGSILSMVSSIGRGATAIKAVSELGAKKEAEGSAPSTKQPKSVPSNAPGMYNMSTVPNTLTSYDMAEPFERVRMEQARKEQQLIFLKKAKEEFKKPQDFSKGFKFDGGK